MLVCGAVMFSVGQPEPGPVPVPVLVQRVTVTVMGGGSWLLAASTTEKVPFCIGTPVAAPRRMGATRLPCAGAPATPGDVSVTKALSPMMFVLLQVTSMVWPVMSVLASWPAMDATCTFEMEAPAHVETLPRPATG